MCQTESNVLVVVVDALRADYAKREVAPTITSLLDSHISCSQAFSPINATEPLLTSFYTGMYPRSNGLIHHGSSVTKRKQNAIRQLPFLQELLSEQGYKTAAIDWMGSWHASGYDYYSGELVERNTSADDESDSITLNISVAETLRKQIPPQIYAGFRRLLHKIRPPTVEPLGWLPDSAEQVTSTAIEQIDDAENPFYLFTHYWDAHAPYDVPEKYTKQFGNLNDPVARYKGGIAYVDDQLQRLLDELDDRGIRDDTLIIVMGDHGESLGEHGIYYDHHGLYDQSIHVPIVLSHPDLPSMNLDSFIQHVDLAPTVLDFLGHDVPPGMDGQSLLPVVEGDADTRSAVVAEEAQTQRKICIRTDRYKYIKHIGDDPVCRGCHVIHGGEEELYDLTEDPDETENVLLDQPAVADTLRTRLNEWMNRHSNERTRIEQVVDSLVADGRF